MNESFVKAPRVVLALGTMALFVLLLAMPMVAYQDSQQTPPDNTRQNQDQSSPTADQQKMNPADRTITQKIRKAIHDDTSLSTYAHNIKIITQDGKVIGRFRATGVRPKLCERLKTSGIHLPGDMFEGVTEVR